MLSIILCASFIIGSLAQGGVNCTASTSCSQCNLVSPGTCGWCAATQTCTQGTITGPLTGKCVGRGQWNFGPCPKCSDFDNDCRGCTLNNRDCGWCDNVKKCVDISDTSTCAPGPQTSCPCTTYQTCSQCTLFSDSQCAWCSKSGTCASPSAINATTCGPLAHDCPCASNRNCDSCLLDFNAVEGGVHVECSWCHGDRQANRTSCVSKTVGCPMGQVTPLNCPTACELVPDCEMCNRRGCVWCDHRNGTAPSCGDPDTVQDCFIQHRCPANDCESRGSCDMCRSEGCTWCFDKQVCTSRGSPTAMACNVDKYPNCSAACASQTSCSACDEMTGCAWCTQNDTTKCIDRGFHQCLGTIGNCSGFAVGTFFLGWLVFALILGVLGGGFFVYRRRMGRPVYTSI